MRQPYRLGLDLGTNSIGWCIIDLTRDGREVGIRRLGVRVFPDGRDPQTKATLAAERRAARQARRRRDRYLRRRQVLLETLISFGLMPGDEADRKALAARPPYELRARGLDEPITLHELGRALFHLSQRRGFKSNRKTSRKDKEAGLIVEGIRALREHLEATGSRTLGEFLYRRLREGRSVRARLQGAGRDAAYEFYPQRELLEEEFDSLWASQARFHGERLSEEARQRIRGVIFYQRPLKPVDPGKCSLEEGEKRAPWALPIAQRFRLLQELANLRVVEPDGLSRRPLTLDERDRILAVVEGRTGRNGTIRKSISFDQIRKALRLERDIRFSHEGEGRSDLPGDQTGALLSGRKCFGPRWLDLSARERDEIVRRLLDEDDETALVAWLMDRWNLDEETALRVSATRLPDGHCRLSERALSRLVPLMQEEGVPDAGHIVRPMRFDEAATRLYGSHSLGRQEGSLDRLPYYGEILGRHVLDAPATANDPEAARWGLIPNPTVHIGLNQLRKLVNEILERYGPPEEIVVELARDLKNSKEDRARIRSAQAKNRARNEEWRKRLRTEFNIDPTPRDLLKMRLWEELPTHRKECVYTGEMITLRHLFAPDSPVEIDHIIPFSRSLDDSAANKILCMRRANRAKTNSTPFEAFGNSPTIEGHNYSWEAIAARAADLPPNKRKRFSADFPAAPDDFLARHLTDTQYLSRIAKEYLTAICHPDRIWVVPGRLTELLRRTWALNDLLGDHNHKDRTDHRHHAIDAFVIGLTTRSRLRRLQLLAEEEARHGTGRKLSEMPAPWPRFREELEAALNRCIVSFKPDHGHQGSLQNDTAYGIVEPDGDAQKPRLVVHRKPLSSFKKRDEIEQVRDARLRDLLLDAVDRGREEGLDLPSSLRRFAEQAPIAHPEYGGLRRVRVCEKLAVIGVADREGRVFKGYKGDSNACFEIRVNPRTGRWEGTVETTFEAYQRIGGRTTESGALPLMRLCKDDLVALDQPCPRTGRPVRIMRVVKFSGGSMVLADHYEAGNLKARHKHPDDPFRYLSMSAESFRKGGGRQVTVGLLGELNDPGHPRQRLAG